MNKGGRQPPLSVGSYLVRPTCVSTTPGHKKQKAHTVLVSSEPRSPRPQRAPPGTARSGSFAQRAAYL